MDLVVTSAAPQAAASLPGDAAAPGAPPSSPFVDLLAALIAGQTAAAGCEYRPQGGAEVACDGKVPEGDPRLGAFFDVETGLPKNAGPRGWTGESEVPPADGAVNEDEGDADVSAAVVAAVPVTAPMTQADVEAIEIAAAAPNAAGSTDAAAPRSAAGAPAPDPASAGLAAPAKSFTNLSADAQIGAESLETGAAVTTAPVETPAASGEETNAAHAPAARALARTLAQFAPDANLATQPQTQTAAAGGHLSAPTSVPESNAAVSSDAAAQAAAASSSPARRPDTIESREFVSSSMPDATDPGIALRGVTPAAGAQGAGDRPGASAPRLETVEISNPPAADGDVATQIVRSIKTSLKDGIGEARVRLRPDYLGEVRIELKVEGDRVSAVLQVERADVRQQVEQGSQSLRSTLAAQGLHLEELTVREDGSRQDRREGERREGNRRQARRPSGGQVFELPE